MNKTQIHDIELELIDQLSVHCNGTDVALSFDQGELVAAWYDGSEPEFIARWLEGQLPEGSYVMFAVAGLRRVVSVAVK